MIFDSDSTIVEYVNNCVKEFDECIVRKMCLEGGSYVK
jgi:hypothetical protein